MDDGSDQDYDSHIMVWQLPCVDGAKVNKGGCSNNCNPEIVVEAAEEAAADAASANSLASSSLDLVPVSKREIESVKLFWIHYHILLLRSKWTFRSWRDNVRHQHSVHNPKDHFGGLKKLKSHASCTTCLVSFVHGKISC